MLKVCQQPSVCIQCFLMPTTTATTTTTTNILKENVKWCRAQEMARIAN
jgi:hypothetical protein